MTLKGVEIFDRKTIMDKFLSVESVEFQYTI